MKTSILHRLENFTSSYKGQVILNYAYSWSAAVVIAAALFKLTHLPYANLMVWIGMGTEVLVFFVSAFELPKKNEPLKEVENSHAIQFANAPALSTPPACPQTNIPNIENLSEEEISNYSNRMKELNESIQRFNTQMTAITAMYEMQLKTASSQVGTVDNVHEQMKRMASQMEQLNNVYERMLQALNNPKN